MEYGTNQEGVAGLLPVVRLLQATLLVDQDVGDVLDVAHLPLAAADLEQRVIGRRFCIGRIEEKDATALATEASGELSVLVLDERSPSPARSGAKG